ncbi:MAG: type II secretion system protein [Lachnospiraceae bacterium]|nr:type II secretion system protein [Lachnospiraceae bacterium]
MRHLRLKKKNGGITLIEIVVALALFAIIVTPLMRNFIDSSRINMKGRKVMIATDVAQSIMEGFAGKTYEDVIIGLDMASGGFEMKDVSSNSAKYAFSAINHGFYNYGDNHAVKVNFPSDKITGITPSTITFSPAVLSRYGATSPAVTPAGGMWYTVSSDEAKSFIAQKPVPLEEVVATSALNNTFLLKTLDNPADPTTLVLGPFEDREPVLGADGKVMKDSNGYDVYPASADKRLYFGYSDDGSDPANGVDRQYTPLMAYMVYTRVNKDQYYFDVVCTFTPMAHSDTEKYYTYNVKLAVYEYTYDVTAGPSGDVVSSDDRVDRTDVDYVIFEGTPIVTLEGGMMNKNQNQNTI